MNSKCGPNYLPLLLFLPWFVHRNFAQIFYTNSVVCLQSTLLNEWKTEWASERVFEWTNYSSTKLFRPLNSFKFFFLSQHFSISLFALYFCIVFDDQHLFRVVLAMAVTYNFDIGKEIRSRRNTCRIKTHKCVSFHVLLYFYWLFLILHFVENWYTAIGSFDFFWFCLPSIPLILLTARYPLPLPFFNFLFILLSRSLFFSPSPSLSWDLRFVSPSASCFVSYFQRTHAVLFKTTANASNMEKRQIH